MPDTVSDDAPDVVHPRHAVDSLTAVIERVIEVADVERVTLRQVFEAFGGASFTPILLLAALVIVTPLSGIPLMSSLMGLVICAVSLQMLLRRQHLWLPKWVLRREISGHLAQKAFRKLRPAASRIDSVTGRRLHYLVQRPLVILPQMLCVLSGALMPLLEVIPFSSSMMGIGVATLALGMLTKDGSVVLVGLIPYLIIAALLQASLA